MKKIKTFALIAFVMVLTLLMASISCFADNKLEDYRTIYEDNLAKIKQTYQKDITLVYIQYDALLNMQMEFYKEEGNLDQYNKVKNEIMKFAFDHEMPENGLHNIVRVKANRDKKKLVLIANYAKALTRLKRNLMQHNNIVSASTVDKEIKKMSLIADDITKSMPKTAKEKLMEGLVLHYDFARNEGDKVTDKSGTGNDGIVHGATWKAYSDGRKGVMEFDGDDNWVQAVRPAIPSGAWTVSFWSLVNDTINNVALLTQSDSHSNDLFNLYGHEGKLYFYNRQPTLKSKSKGSTSISIRDTWAMHTIVRTAAGCSFYENGIMKDKVGNFSEIGGTLFMVGRTYSTYLKGSLDDIMVWNRALSEDEVGKIYRPQK